MRGYRALYSLALGLALTLGGFAQQDPYSLQVTCPPAGGLPTQVSASWSVEVLYPSGAIKVKLTSISCTNPYRGGHWIVTTSGQPGSLGGGRTIVDANAYYQMSAGNSYYVSVNDGVSDWQTIGPFVTQPTTFKVVYQLPKNTTAKDIRYDVMQNGVSVGHTVVPPGGGGIPYTFDGLDTSIPTSLVESRSNFVRGDDGAWYAGDATVLRTVAVGGAPVPSTSASPSAASVTGPTQVTASGEVPPPSGVTNSANTNVWLPKSAVGTGTGTNPSTSDMTLSGYREGVDKLTDATKTGVADILTGLEVNAAAQSTRDGVTQGILVNQMGALTNNGQKTDVTNVKLDATNQKLDAANVHLAAIEASVGGATEDKVGAVINAEKLAFDTDAKLTEAQSKGAAAFGSNYTGAKPSGSAPNVQAPSGGPGTLGTVEVGGRSIVIGFTPDLWAGADGVLKACRPLLLFALVCSFAWSAGGLITQYVTGLGAVGQADAAAGIENLAPGVVQGKTWGAAGVIVATMLTTVAAMIAVADTAMAAAGVGVASLFSSFNLAGIGSVGGLLDSYIPLGAIASLGIMRAALPYLIAPLYVGAASIIKFAKA